MITVLYMITGTFHDCCTLRDNDTLHDNGSSRDNGTLHYNGYFT